jgi:hypothetical protein
VSINSKVIDKKIAKLYGELDMEKLLKLLDRKMHKDDADQMFYESNNKAQVMERGIVRVHQHVEQIEVRDYTLFNCSLSLRTWLWPSEIWSTAT